jgi:hypothetical protein
MGAFDVEKFANFEPTAMGGFDSAQVGNFEPTAMGGFDAEKFSNFDPTAMAGFDATHLENFEPEAVSGFARDHVVGMGVDALVGFEVEHVINLDQTAKDGFGDKVTDFEDFDLEVRGELIGEEAQRMGGFGSFDDLMTQIGGDGPSPEELAELGWSEDFDLADVNFGTEDTGIVWPDYMPADDFAKALEAFNPS